jgi:hypothetical protein
MPYLLPSYATSDRYIDAATQFLEQRRNLRHRDCDVRMIHVVAIEPWN